MCTARLFPVAFLLLFSLFLSLSAQTGPGGVGANDGSSSLLLWLKADAIAGLNDGAPMEAWADQSGGGRHAIQPNPAMRPTYESDGANSLNGKPVVRFQNNNTALVNNSFTFSGQFTTVAVYWTPSPRIADASKRLFSAPGATAPDDAGGISLIEYSTGSVTPRINITVNGSGSTARYAIGKKMAPSGAIIDGESEFDGNIAELIVFNESLNHARRIILENYLARKYNIPALENRYNSSTHVVDVAGIGRLEGIHASAESGGMILSDHGALDAEGKFFLFGHGGTENVFTNSNLPAGVMRRWSRDWYIDQTGEAGNKNISVSFDFSDAGITESPLSAGDYVLLARSGASGGYTVINAGVASLEGDRVTFTLPESNITDRYYTLGVLPPSGSNSGGNISTTGPGGFVRNDGTSNMILWLRADAINDLQDGRPLGTWYDQSGYGNDATQNLQSLRPTFESDPGNSINGKPVVRFYEKDAVLRNTNFAYTGDFTSFAVWAVPSSRISNRTKRVFSAPNATQDDYLGGIWIQEINTGTVAPKMDYSRQTNSNRNTSQYALGRYLDRSGNVASGSYEFDGNIAEVIVFNDRLGNARRVIIENYLSAKYGIVCSDDRYAEKNYVNDLAGIGRSSETISSAASGGMVITDHGSLVTEEKYFMFGHNGQSAITVSDRLPFGLVGRWNREWFIDQSGPLNSGRISIAFDFDAADLTIEPGDPDNYKLLKRSGTTDLYEVVPVKATVEGHQVIFETDDNTISDGYYTLGLSVNDSPLPVELVSFSAHVEGERIALRWNTASEVNNAGFILNRSTRVDSGFIPIASYQATPALVGQGTSSVRSEYRYVDASILSPGTRYFYRIESVSTDGTIERIATTAIDLPARDEDAVIFFRIGENWPNPCVTATTIPFALPDNDNVTFIVRDMQGRELRREEIDGVSGENSYLFNTAGLAPGAYWYQLKLGNQIRQRMMIVL
jgi:hypothetical protein